MPWEFEAVTLAMPTNAGVDTATGHRLGPSMAPESTALVDLMFTTTPSSKPDDENDAN